MRVFHLRRQIWLPRPLKDVFAFFADPRNLAEITPPWLRFEVLTPQPLEMQVGMRIDYRLKIRGIPLRWQSEITAWAPPDRFVDEQRRGPYLQWIHEHGFCSARGGTEVEDFVSYAARGGSLVERFLIRPDLDRIFDYRGQRMRALFGGTGGIKTRSEMEGHLSTH